MNTRFQAKAEETQRERFGGKAVWQHIRAMQSGTLVHLAVFMMKMATSAPYY